MEYSVSDLVKILLRRWYVILLVMAVFAGISYPLAKRSYDAAVENYESYTTQTMPIETQAGKMNATVYFQFGVENMQEYVVNIQNKREFLAQYEAAVQGDDYSGKGSLNLYVDAMEAYNTATAELKNLVASEEVFEMVDKAMGDAITGPATVNDAGEIIAPGSKLTTEQCMVASIKSDGVLEVTIERVSEETSAAMLDAYLSAVSEAAEENELVFEALDSVTDYQQTSSEQTELAELSQDILVEPTNPPQMIRTVGTAAVFGFAFGCFFVLLITFILEAKRLNQLDQKPTAS